ncbi:MAG: peptidoglycan bridge formation glycyltransferase FemA/FemB family protein [Candidatus Magasanikbacteria bacterium]|nr:peptidoglycan bridge formation glycyltransferase FemA/FemB family protein [Candidatus Magasanikbacteria bacterium]NCS72218.1 peptidoglycan bridge formation glycyltransferase FemA/FemB family protein [Candidatus Magasanikbacteria bacterium]
MFHIKQLDNHQEWETFNKNTPYSVFVQSTLYGEFYEKLGEQYVIFGVYDEKNTLIGGSLAVTTHAKRGNFLYLPYGPIIDFKNKTLVKQFFDTLKAYAKEQHLDFIRISPLTDDSKLTQKTLKDLGFISAPMHVLAENSWLLNLTVSKETLLKNMKKNHRNLIRRCEREGVIVQKKHAEGLNTLHKLLDETAKRLKFHRFSRKYINDEFEIFNKHNQALIFEATLPDGTIDASAIIMFYGNMAVYRHSASLNTNKKVPSSYLVQWEVIKEAKKRGMTWYNFWGVEPPHAKKTHPFAGIGHFKRGFGGEQKDLLHCHDLPLTPKYWLNWLVETIRKYKRGF